MVYWITLIFQTRIYLNLCMILKHPIKVSFEVWPGTESVRCHVHQKVVLILQHDVSTYRYITRTLQWQIHQTDTSEWQDVNNPSNQLILLKQTLECPRENYSNYFLTSKHVYLGQNYVGFHPLYMMSHVSKSLDNKPCGECVRLMYIGSWGNVVCRIWYIQYKLTVCG